MGSECCPRANPLCVLQIHLKSFSAFEAVVCFYSIVQHIVLEKKNGQHFRNMSCLILFECFFLGENSHQPLEAVWVIFILLACHLHIRWIVKMFS